MGRLGAVWGLGGLLALLSFSTARLGHLALGAFSYDLAWYHWTVLVVNAIFMAYSEGYRGFHHAFSPRVVARARHLLHNPRPLHVLLAPVFCMGYFHATRRRLIGTYALTAMIVFFAVAVRQLTQPWRGVIAVGVVLGLALGIASVVSFILQALSGELGKHSPEVPASTG